MHVGGIKPVVVGTNLLSVAAGGSSVPGRVAGMGRAAMIANFCNMMDEWVDLMKKYQERDSKGGAAIALMYTSKLGANGQQAAQGMTAADLAPVLALAVA